MSFDERRFKITILAVESFGRLREDGCEFVDELQHTPLGGRMGSPSHEKGESKERLLQDTSVAAQVAISRRVHQYKLSLRGRQADTAGHLHQQVSGGSTTMTWGWAVDQQIAYCEVYRTIWQEETREGHGGARCERPCMVELCVHLSISHQIKKKRLVVAPASCWRCSR